jgi:hypothetical protein
MKKIGFLTLVIMRQRSVVHDGPPGGSGCQPEGGPGSGGCASHSSGGSASDAAAPASGACALEALRSAKEHMAHAEGEFHGHRAKAIEHIDAAIHEAEVCLNEP